MVLLKFKNCVHTAMALDSYSNEVIFYVNNNKVVLNNPDPLMTLNDYLRSTSGLKGTKKMCNQVRLGKRKKRKEKRLTATIS